MSGSLDRSRITRLFGELSEELERKRVRGHVYVVGGAALIAGFGRDRSTNDVDGRITEAKADVLAAAARVGRRNGLPEDWLNGRGLATLAGRDFGEERGAEAVQDGPWSTIVIRSTACWLPRRGSRA